jgi:hypothetical protein
MTQKHILKSRIAQFYLYECLLNTQIIKTQNKIDKLNKKLKDQYDTMTSQEVGKIRSKILLLEAELFKLKN